MICPHLPQRNMPSEIIIVKPGAIIQRGRLLLQQNPVLVVTETHRGFSCMGNKRVCLTLIQKTDPLL